MQLTGLAPDTTYHFRVTSADGGAQHHDLAEPASGAGHLHDADRRRHRHDRRRLQPPARPGASTYVSDTAGGEVILAPTVGAEFGGTTLPAGWIENPAPWSPAAARLRVCRRPADASTPAARQPTADRSGPAARSSSSPPSAAQRHPERRVLGGRLQRPWVVVSTGTAGDGVYARSRRQPDRRRRWAQACSRVAASLPDRVDRDRFRLLRRRRASHTSATLARTMRQLNAGAAISTPAATLSIDWMRMTPYASPGTFLSRIHDAGSPGPTGAPCRTSPMSRRHDARARGPHRRHPDAGRLMVHVRADRARARTSARSSRYLQYRVDGHVVHRRRHPDPGVGDAAVHARRSTPTRPVSPVARRRRTPPTSPSARTSP